MGGGWVSSKVSTRETDRKVSPDRGGKKKGIGISTCGTDSNNEQILIN